MELISKELLKNVMNLKRINKIYLEDNNLHFCEFNRPINIHELAHKCKEWACKVKNYAIYSGFDKMEKHYECNLMQICFRANTEHEAIFKACQWILENKKDLGLENGN